MIGSREPTRGFGLTGADLQDQDPEESYTRGDRLRMVPGPFIFVVTVKPGFSHTDHFNRIKSEVSSP